MILDSDLMYINSAKRASEYGRMRESEADRQREVDSAILDSAARSKMQVVILEKQLVEARRTNELLVQQATDAALDARKSRNIAWLSVVISILAIIATVVIGVWF